MTSMSLKAGAQAAYTRRVATVLELVLCLTLFVLLEKLVPRGDLLARAAGVALLLAGGAQLLRAFGRA